MGKGERGTIFVIVYGAGLIHNTRHECKAVPIPAADSGITNLDNSTCNDLTGYAERRT
jgi:hypothetical protein